MSGGLRALAHGLWVAERPLGNPLAEVGTRMTAIRLRDGGLFLHSPVKLDVALREALDALGPVHAIVCPNRAHHLFAGDYVAAFPHARLYGAPNLAPKRRDLTFAETLADTAPALWRGELEQHFVRGIPLLNEVAFFHLASRTLLLTDLAFNIPIGGAKGARLFCWISGAEGRFGPHRLLRNFMVRDRVAARASLERVLAWDFDRVTLTHGAVLESGGRDALRAGISFLR